MSKKWFGIVFQTSFLLSSLARSRDIQARLKDFVITSAFDAWYILNWLAI